MTIFIINFFIVYAWELPALMLHYLLDLGQHGFFKIQQYCAGMYTVVYFSGKTELSIKSFSYFSSEVLFADLYDPETCREEMEAEGQGFTNGHATWTSAMPSFMFCAKAINENECTIMAIFFYNLLLIVFYNLLPAICISTYVHIMQIYNNPNEEGKKRDSEKVATGDTDISLELDRLGRITHNINKRTAQAYQVQGFYKIHTIILVILHLDYYKFALCEDERVAKKHDLCVADYKKLSSCLQIIKNLIIIHILQIEHILQ
ncbi:hypothetical protein ACJX0J_016328 [Zea mays]